MITGDTVVTVAWAVAESLGDARIMERGRSTALAMKRHLGYWMMRELGYSYPQIGRAFGRDHATVMAGVRAVNGAMTEELLTALRARLAPLQEQHRTVKWMGTSKVSYLALARGEAK